jgi:hypothetical protein
MPRLDVGQRVALERQAGTGQKEAALVREVRVIGMALDPRALRDLRHRRPRRPQCGVQVDRRLDDPASRLVLPIGALAEAIGAAGGTLFHCTRLCI